MASDPERPPVRVRTRVRTVDGEQRLMASAAPAPLRKRAPNAGSMKKGETRNPKGRPKGAKGTKSKVRKVLQGKVTVREGGRPKKVTLFDALLLKEVEMAFNGDWRARNNVFALGRWALPEEDPIAATTSLLEQSETDRTVLAWFEGEVKARLEKERSND
jgi:hypothetical protein